MEIHRARKLIWVCALLLLAGCQGSNKTGSSGKTPASGTTESALASLSAIKPLNDRANPYQARYREWDHWIAANAVAVTAPGVNPSSIFEFNPEGDPGQNGHFSLLDENGYLMPLTERLRLLEESMASESAKQRLAVLRTVTSMGAIDPALLQRSLDACEETRAAFYRPIPGWLAQHPPERSILLPNGEVVTRGMPGSGAKPAGSAGQTAGKAEGCCGGSSTAAGWFRYSAEGELLASTKREWWWFLYFDPELRDLPQGSLHFRADGYAELSDPVSGELLAVYDFDGAELPAVRPSERDKHPFMQLTAERLATYYKAQQRLPL